MSVFSDFFDDRDDALGRILTLRGRRNDVALFHVLDPAELEFPFDDPTLFLSLEDERRIEVNAREIRESGRPACTTRARWRSSGTVSPRRISRARR